MLVYILIAFLIGLIITFLDSMYGKQRFLGKDFKDVGYHIKIYPFIISLPYIPLLILYPEKWNIWFGMFLLSWALNDILWFLVDPKEWKELWGFKNRLIYVWKLWNGKYIKVTDTLMTLVTILRILFAIFLFLI